MKLLPANKWKFAVGISFHTTVTVKAPCYVAAVQKAWEALNTRYEKAGREDMIPTCWTLTLIKAGR